MARSIHVPPFGWQIVLILANCRGHNPENDGKNFREIAWRDGARLDKLGGKLLGDLQGFLAILVHIIIWLLKTRRWGMAGQPTAGKLPWRVKERKRPAPALFVLPPN